MSPIVVHHPLAQHILTQLRDERTTPDRFRPLSQTLTTVLVLEATRKMPVRTCRVQTPLTETQGIELAHNLAAVPILRAGLGMLETVLNLFPSVTVGYIGLERNEETALARTYYSKLPSLANRFTLCLDPMLATGGSAVRALTLLKEAGAQDLTMVSIVSAPEGIEEVASQHPDVPIFTAAIDSGLNDLKYIVPGLGDFGDRLYGTG
ncbi:MAG: uracil phosphoribosyltransferase [Fimbriimonas sp.]